MYDEPVVPLQKEIRLAREAAERERIAREKAEQEAKAKAEAAAKATQNGEAAGVSQAVPVTKEQ